MKKKRGKRPGLRARSHNARFSKNVPRETIDEAIYRFAERAVTDMVDRLRRCRSIMEVNDPGNARDIFGQPEES